MTTLALLRGRLHFEGVKMDMYGSKKGKKTSSCSAKPGMPKGTKKGNGSKKGMK